MQQSQGNGSSSSTSSILSRRRPHIWQDDMAEVKETFRRVARARHSSGYSAGETSPSRVTAPILSRNRRARVRCQVPAKALLMSPGGLQVPVKVLQEIRGNRSQSPFVSLNHLQNVLGMCRRIRSQQSLTERKKNPHDPGVYPVYVRRPWSVSACMCHKPQAHHDANPNRPHHPRLHCKGYPHIGPQMHDIPSQQHDILSGHSKADVHADVDQCCIENSPEQIRPCANHQVITSAIPNCSISRNAATHLPFNSYPQQPSPNEPTTPLYYKPARFKPLYDISNGVFPHSHMRKRAAAAPVNEKLRTSAQEKPLWAHYGKPIHHPLVDDYSANTNHPRAAGVVDVQQSPAFNNISAALLQGSPFAWSSPENMESLIITKKPRTRSSPMGFSESWPSSSSFSNDPHYHHHHHHHHHHQHFADNLQTHFHCSEVADFLNSDRRPHSENDLNLHSTSYFLERPPSRCMKRPLSSCSFAWRNVSAFLAAGNCAQQDVQSFECGYAEAWSPNTSSSQQDVSIFIPRDLDGNILSSSHGKMNSSESFKHRHAKNADCKSRSFGGAPLDSSKKHKPACVGQTPPMQSSKLVHNSSSKPCAKRGTSKARGATKKKSALASTSSCLDDLEGLPPSKWAKRLASDFLGPYGSNANTTNDYSPVKEFTSSHAAQAHHSFGNSFNKHRVKFASPSVQIQSEGFRKEAQSLAAAEMIPDLLSWERDSGLLTGDPPVCIVRTEDEEELDQKLLEQVEAMLDASSTSSSSRSPSPSAEISPMRLCSPAHHSCSDSSSKTLTEMEMFCEAEAMFAKEGIHSKEHLVQQDYEQQLPMSFQKEKNEGNPNLEQSGIVKVKSTTDIACAEKTLVKEQVKLPAQGAEKGRSDAAKQHVSGSVVNIHHSIALIEVMESQCNMEEMGGHQEDQVTKSAEPSPKLRRGTEEHGHQEDQVMKSTEPLPKLCRGSKERGGDENGSVDETEEGEEGENAAANRELEADEGVSEEHEVDPCVGVDGGVRVHAKHEAGASVDGELELGKLFKDALDLNPTFHHLYDTMSHLNASTCAAAALNQISSSSL